MSRIYHQPLTRRCALQAGGLTALGLGLPDWLRLQQVRAAEAEASGQTAARRTATACILIWLDGGPSHIDTFDPKPHAPAEVRGPFAAIATKIPGVQLSELVPRLAQRMDRCALIRSMTSPLGEHNLATQYLLSGYQPGPVLQYPTLCSAVAAIRQGGGDLPQWVAVPDFQVGGGAFSSHGFLPAQFGPFATGGDPADRGFRIDHLQPPQELSLARIDRRRRYLMKLDAFDQLGDAAAPAAAADPVLEQAHRMLTAPAARQAFRLDRETAATRAAYGPKTIGQSCLLARRLIESGVPLVTVTQRGWDTHDDLITRLRDGYTGAKTPVGLGPSLDQAVAALLDDLQQRGRLQDTLVIVMGEFGRTPKWNVAGGRDHWPRAFSVLLAGGPIRGGTVHGSSDAQGESPAESPVTPADLAHTIYRALGVDPAIRLHTPDGRPVRLADERAAAVEEILV